MRAISRFSMIAIAFLVTATAHAEVVSLKILKREPFAGGKAFDKAGPYDAITAVATFAIDPKDSRNRVIVDLDLAPRNQDGKVEFKSDVTILTPKDPGKGNGAIFYDVNNRGNKLMLGMFNRPPGGPGPDTNNLAGDGFLMRQGYTVVWSGWDGELLSGGASEWTRRLLLEPPQVPVRGLVRQETLSDTKVKSMPLSRRPFHGSYFPATKEANAKAVLTKRTVEPGMREVVPRAKWKLVLTVRPVPTFGDHSAQQSLHEVHLELEDGFEPGVLYEVIYESEGSNVQGVGFAAVRDLISFLRHDASDKNPLRTAAGKPAINRAFSFGVSQSGRFLRHLLYQGFNEDTQGRIVFDGLIPHVAGAGLGFFNHRFAQPNRHNGQHEDHLFPSDVFPFTYGPSTDPFTKQTDSILGVYEKSKTQPKVMHTQSAAEYWHRAGSLVHTDPLGKTDAVIPGNVRIYSFGGTQHGPAPFPPVKSFGDNYNNFGDYRPFLRALIVALDEWVRTGKEPPPSVYPKLTDRTAVAWTREGTGFPMIPGVRFPLVIQQPSYNDYGKDFRTTGIITKEPPTVVGDYVVLVPKGNADGNDLGMLSPPEVAVPLGTFTGWNLRKKAVGSEGSLASLMGSFLPFPTVPTMPPNPVDPRPSVQQRYASSKMYVDQLDAECDRLVKARYILAEDRPRYAAYGEAIWKNVMKK